MAEGFNLNRVLLPTSFLEIRIGKRIQLEFASSQVTCLRNNEKREKKLNNFDQIWQEKACILHDKKGGGLRNQF